MTTTRTLYPTQSFRCSDGYGCRGGEKYEAVGVLAREACRRVPTSLKYKFWQAFFPRFRPYPARLQEIIERITEQHDTVHGML